MITGETLRLLRTIKGIKQETIARKLGVSQPAYCKLEQCNRIKEEKMLQLLQIFNISTEELEALEKICKRN